MIGPPLLAFLHSSHDGSCTIYSHRQCLYHVYEDNVNGVAREEVVESENIQVLTLIRLLVDEDSEDR